MMDKHSIPQNDWIQLARRCIGQGLSWDGFRACQAMLMPRCQTHNRPTATTWHGEPFCDQCARELEAISHAVQMHQEAR
jgi:hypothetical protein